MLKTIHVTCPYRSKKSDFVFSFYYVLFFFSLFLDDVGVKFQTLLLVSKLAKLIVLCLLAGIIFTSHVRRDRLRMACLCLFIGFMVLISAGDFFLLIVIMMGVASSRISDSLVLRLSIGCIVSFSIIVFLLFVIGLLPDNVSARTGYSETLRHSFGFAHSTVFPLIIFYLLTYLLMLKKEHVNRAELAVILMISFILYCTCDSRNAIIGVILLMILWFLYKNAKPRYYRSKMLNFCFKMIFALCTVASFLPAYLRSKNQFMLLWYIYDKIFTNRSLFGSSAINAFGIHILTVMKSSEYRSTPVLVDSAEWTGVILDNGYMYIIIRYGWVAIMFLGLVFWGFYKKYRYMPFAQAVIVVVAVVNMTDNDFLSYGFLPYMLIGIKYLCTVLRDESRSRVRCVSHDRINDFCMEGITYE